MDVFWLIRNRTLKLGHHYLLELISNTGLRSLGVVAGQLNVSATQTVRNFGTSAKIERDCSLDCSGCSLGLFNGNIAEMARLVLGGKRAVKLHRNIEEYGSFARDLCSGLFACAAKECRGRECVI